MLDILLHTGSEHPNLWWVVVPSLLSLLAGIGIGASSDRARNLFDGTDETTTSTE